jgi:hypothetical protein
MNISSIIKNGAHQIGRYNHRFKLYYREREREREWGVGGGKRILVSKLTHRKKLLILGLGRLLPRLSDIK